MDNPATETALNLWLSERQALVLRLSDELRAGFQAVAEFHARNYLDCIERQEALAAKLAAHDAHMPELPAAAEDKRRLADAVRAMNTSLRRLADIHAALIDLGSRSARCFQRVWALGAASYTLPHDPAGAPGPRGPRRAELSALESGPRGCAALGARDQGKER